MDNNSLCSQGLKFPLRRSCIPSNLKRLLVLNSLVYWEYTPPRYQPYFTGHQGESASPELTAYTVTYCSYLCLLLLNITKASSARESMGRPYMISAQTGPRPPACKETDGLLVSPDKASTLLTDHLITHVLGNSSDLSLPRKSGSSQNHPYLQTILAIGLVGRLYLNTFWMP